MALFQLEWYDGEEWQECEMEGDPETIREQFLKEEAEDGKTVDNLTIKEI